METLWVCFARRFQGRMAHDEENCSIHSPPAPGTKSHGDHLLYPSSAGRSAICRCTANADTATGRSATCKDTRGPARLAGGADCALSRPVTSTNAGRLHLSPGNHSTPAMAREKQEPQGQGTCRCRCQTTLGSQHSGA